MSTFVAECRVAARASIDALRFVVAEAVSEPEGIVSFGEPGSRSGISYHCRDRELTIYSSVASAGTEVPPHNHGVWAVAGIAAGMEQNLRYRRLPDGTVVLDRSVLLRAGDVMAFEPEAIHAACNPDERTVSLHVYLGDLLATPRTIWSRDGTTPRAMPLLAGGGVDEAEAFSTAYARRTAPETTLLSEGPRA